MGNSRSYKVAVLMGGVSNERTVSIKSGLAVAEGLRKAGHEAVPFEVRDTSLDGLARINADVAFIALHGAFGEDGSVQEMLDELDIPYTGSGAKASRRGMDKARSKELFVRHAIPTAGYFTVKKDESAEHVADSAETLGYPLVCKPVCGGSSIGVTLVRSESQLESALATAFEEDDRALLEMYVRGREITVGVLEGDPLPVIELIADREFFDYEAKYADDKTRYVMPVSMLPTTYWRVQDTAVRAYQALGCRHMARVDMLLGYDGDVYVLEVNTIPGFTPRSLLPMAAAETGLPFADLCDRLVRAAVRDAASARRRRRMTA